jgi:hypothetical protein
MAAASVGQRTGNVRQLRAARSQKPVTSENALRAPLRRALWHGGMPRVEATDGGDGRGRMATGRPTKKAACEDCFFRCNLLCALELDEPCTTFRPDSPEGLRPPQQLRFSFRQERRTQAAWAFPSAQEQASLHAS